MQTNAMGVTIPLRGQTNFSTINAALDTINAQDRQIDEALGEAVAAGVNSEELARLLRAHCCS